MKTKKMLINTRQNDEIRVALMEGKRLLDLDIELSHKKQKKANIYKAKISRVEPSLNAVFVDYGMEKHGFLPVKEIAPQYLPKHVRNLSDISLKEIFKEGQDILIQVEKEERGTKGAAISTYISLAGCYLVIMPNNPKAGGISRKIEGEARQELKNMMKSLDIPDNMGTILRTACLDRSQEELQWDIDALCKIWQAIDDAYQANEAPCLIYQESDVVFRSIRDYLRQEITEIIVDTEHTYNRVVDLIQKLRPNFVDRVKQHQSEVPLFSHYNIENQIETTHTREITLPSGASIVIDPAEALTAIDINSAKATKGGNIEETALNINLEAAEEIARQLRLRDLGGLIVIDFIDMSSYQDQQKVEQKLTNALRSDRARTQINHISRFGLLEMSRQRLRSSVDESTRIVCPRCHGQGTIRGIESLAMSMIRKIKQALVEKAITEIQVQLPISVATYLLNEKRQLIDQMEQAHQIRIVIIPNPHLETPNADVKLIKAKQKADKSSHQLLQKPAKQNYNYQSNANKVESPAVDQTDILNNTKAKQSKPGFLNRVYQGLFGTDTTTKATAKQQTPSPAQNTNKQHKETTRTHSSSKPSPDRNKQSQRKNNSNQQRSNQKSQKNSQSGGNTKRQTNNPQEKSHTPPKTAEQHTPPKQKPTSKTEQTKTTTAADTTPAPTNIEKPKRTAPKRPSKMVKDILAKDSVLSDQNSQKIDTTAKGKPISKVIKIEQSQAITEFSLEKAKARLAEFSKQPMDMVNTQAEQTVKLPVKIQVKNQNV